MHEILNFMERQKIESEDADIFITVVSEKNSDSFKAPMTVNELLKLYNFTLTISFSCIPD